MIIKSIIIAYFHNPLSALYHHPPPLHNQDHAKKCTLPCLVVTIIIVLIINKLASLEATLVETLPSD